MPPKKTTKKPIKASSSASLQKQKASNVESQATPAIPKVLQQQLLNIFRDACNDAFQEGIEGLLQEVKGHLYNRDFDKAFGRDDYLQAYAARWSPSRALGYLQILEKLKDEVTTVYERISATDEGASAGAASNIDAFRIVCVGGGAGAELVALAGLCRLQRDKADTETHPTYVTCIDIANWDPVVRALYRGVTTSPVLSKYASEAAKAANTALLATSDFTADFFQRDVFSLEEQDWDTIGQAHMVTIMFTLNELYSTSPSKTQDFLKRMTSAMSSGALLLVVDSPGSYSTVSVNGSEHKYPMSFLADLLLIGKGSGVAEEDIRMEKLMQIDSEWFRLPEGLKYPIELENMRYQLHLYRAKPTLDATLRINFDEQNKRERIT